MKLIFNSFIMVFLVFFSVCSCSEKNEFSKIEELLRKNKVSIEGKSKLFLYDERSCESCFHTMGQAVSGISTSDFLLIYISNGSRTTLKNSVFYDYLKNDKNFRVVSDRSLYDNLVSITQDYKGGYYIPIINGQIQDVLSISMY